MPTTSATATPTRRRLTAPRRRRQLIDVALETFAQTGYTATTMEDIALAAGVTKPLLYQHFASKRSLYLELIDDVTHRLIEMLERAASSETALRRKVESGMLAYFRFALENRSAMRMLFDAPPDEELARGLRSIQEAIASFVAPLIEADLDEEHRHTLAIAIVGMTEGVTRHWLRHREREVPGADAEKESIILAERVSDLAWSGLRAVHRVP
jgi:AcrR family transcriptional regulator